MDTSVSKSQFKPRALEYLRLVEQQKKSFVITHAGKPVAQVIPYIKKDDSALARLKGSIVAYAKPYEPVGEEDWEALR
ncbi:MAG: type II toxin-antitoxin system prevent-host-death family antitoxin [Candidatus Chisholmbacteria bacterium]|nr:type II toxin-antitoxin system prevent-host-death family antitoxin [Candidatus Chisholmbacteria bacterium]